MPTSDRRTRPRRGSTLDDVPEQLRQWFEHGGPPGWYVLLPYECDLLPARWRSWKKQHPKATPPEGFSWLDDPADRRHPSEAEVREARRLLKRDLPRD